MTVRRRARRASSRVVRSSSSTPAFAASTLSASGKLRPSRFITKLKTSPPSPQPKHFHESRAGVTVNEGVFSPWKGQRPLYVEPAFFSWTVSPTTSTTLSLLLTSAATPTDKPSSCPRAGSSSRRGAFGRRTWRWACQDLTSRSGGSYHPDVNTGGGY